ncbi:MAG: hypothetical protein ABI870_09225 [Rhodanobacter sp.]
MKGKKTGGRTTGALNKATKTIKELAQPYGEEALSELVKIMRDSEAPHATRVAASREILDRGYGKASQAVDIKSSDGSMAPRGLDHFYGVTNPVECARIYQQVMQGEGA